MSGETPGVIPMISYVDGIAALEWLARAFGCRGRARLMWPDGRLSAGEPEAGDGLIMLAIPSPAEDLEGRFWFFMERGGR